MDELLLSPMEIYPHHHVIQSTDVPIKNLHMVVHHTLTVSAVVTRARGAGSKG